jgi:Transcriptional activator of glycolytic enzymes
MWLTDTITPLIKSRMNEELAHTLAPPILWACFDDEYSLCLPEAMKEEVKRQFYLANPSWDNNVNPVKKELLSVHDNEGELFVQPIQLNDEDQVMQALPGGGNVSESIMAIQHQVAALQREQFEIKSEIEMFRKEQRIMNRIMAKAIKRIARQPARIVGRTRFVNQTGEGEAEVAAVENDDEEVDRRPATLSRNPKTLFSLWREYIDGLGGRKAAKDFTSAERGQVKSMYHRRKVVWDTVALLVRAGHTAETAIERIYDSYGRSETVTRIIGKMLRDRRTGGHPNLRMGPIPN